MINFLDRILFLTKVNRESDGDLYSACSNPTSVVLVIVLGMIIGAKRQKQKHSWLLSYQRQSLREHFGRKRGMIVNLIFAETVIKILFLICAFGSYRTLETKKRCSIF